MTVPPVIDAAVELFVQDPEVLVASFYKPDSVFTRDPDGEYCQEAFWERIPVVGEGSFKVWVIVHR